MNATLNAIAFSHFNSIKVRLELEVCSNFLGNCEISIP